MKKLISKIEATNRIKDDMTVCIGGFGSYDAPETLLCTLAERYRQEGSPRNLTVCCGVTPGNLRKDPVGVNRLAADGLIGTMIAAHYANAPLMADRIGENKLAGFAVPLGVMVHLFDATAGHKGGVLTKVGLGTFADPRQEGCCANEKAAAQNRNLVELVNLNDEEYLFYKSIPMDVCLIRAEYADEEGNLAMPDSAVGDYSFDMAAAVHNNGGIVIAEVKDIVPTGSLHPKKVLIHAPMVDYVVQADPGMYVQSYAADYRPELCGDARIPAGKLEILPMSNRKVIARRSVMEMKKEGLINLGIGIPSAIGMVANEEGIRPTLSLETGPQGGIPVEGMGFSASVNPDAMYTLANIFHLYDGGLLDSTFLGAAEIDRYGNVNVSKFGTRCAGPGGFINISQNTKNVYFVGTFTAGGLEEGIEDGKLIIRQEGRCKKFLNRVQQITFSGEYARKTGQHIMYITERAVFTLEENGLVLREIAPGIDLEQDILAQMEFVPVISEDLKEMDARIFIDAPMGLDNEYEK